MTRFTFIFFSVLFPLILNNSIQAQTTQISGELKKWHKITLNLEGPTSNETATPNPFLDYRFEVFFTHVATGKTYRVPGYFAADGNAAETGAGTGNKWFAHLAPPETGTWNYQISFRSGNEVAIDTSLTGGIVLTPYDGISGSFVVTDTDKTGRDFRAKGLLSYVGEHYYQFQGNGEYFLKFGPDSPENLLGYFEFDSTRTYGGSNTRRTKGSGTYTANGIVYQYQGDILHHYEAHVPDWNPGDPVWHTNKGKGIIGALNYLATVDMNCISFLVMNIDGDGQDSYPYATYDGSNSPTDYKLRFDVSKLSQWEIVFEHATKKGLFMDIKTQETENDQLLDGGQLGVERKLFFRELVARFGHHLALQWNLGEENDIWSELNDPNNNLIKEYALYLLAVDPYWHPIVIHSYPSDQDEVYDPLLGSQSMVTGPALQSNMASIVHKETLEWIQASADSNRKWVVSTDEIGPAAVGVTPDYDDPSGSVVTFFNNHEEVRKQVLWGNLMAGGAGMQTYFGYNYFHHDLDLEWFGSRERFWEYMRYAKDFFETIPFYEMTNKNELIGNTNKSNDKYCFGKDGESYVIYLANGDSTDMDMSGLTGNYKISWYDPRNGGNLQSGSIAGVAAGNATTNLGSPPDSTSRDWVVLLQNRAILLPVEYMEFYVKPVKRGVKLAWSTFSERNADRFIIERRDEHSLWKSLGVIKAEGNSHELQSYEYIDKPSSNGLYSYRLVQLDLDGSRNYSNEVEIELFLDANLEVFPNPTTESLNLRFKGINTSYVKLSIWNQHGQKVYSSRIQQIPANHQVSLPTSKWASGLYYIQFETANNVLRKSFVKQ